MRSASVSLALFVVLGVLASCGGNSSSGSSSGSVSGTGGSGTTTPPKQAYLYVSETGQSANASSFSAFMEGFAINNSNGALTPITGSPFSTKFNNAGDLEVSPNNQFLYLAAQSFGNGCCIGPESLVVFSIDASSGVPTQTQALVSAGTAPYFSIAVHPSGNFLYTSPYTNNNTGVGIYSVASDGTVSFTTADTSVQSADTAVITPDGKHLYTNTDGAPVGNWPKNSACGPVVTNLWGYDIDSSSGALTPIAGSPFTFQRNECVVGHQSTNLIKQVDTQSQRLFVIDEANSNLLTFSIGSNGALTQQSGMSSGFSSVALTPNDKFLYAGGVLEFWGYNISTSNSGTLNPVPGSPFSVAPVPAGNEAGSTAMAIDPSGIYLFSNGNNYTSAYSCCGPDNLDEFSINASTGALKQMTVKPANLIGAASKMVVAAP